MKTLRPHRYIERALACTALFALVVIAWARLTPLPRELAEGHGASSLRVEDGDGHLLREVRAGDGARARWASLSELGPAAASAMIAAEDRRFYRHLGVDPFAVVRAAASSLRHLRVVSGASTITMQLARTVEPHRRNLWGKVEEMVLALRIEMSLSKAQILEAYMNGVTFGPNLRGFSAASWAYFDKPPATLSTAEAALIAGLVRAPSVYAPARHADLARARRDRVLSRMQAMGVLDADRAERARAEPIRPESTRPTFGAPHLVEGLVGGALRNEQPGLTEALARPALRLTTTVDGSLQRAAEAAVGAALEGLRAKQVTAASAVVLDNATGDVLAYVGSPDYFDDARLGQNDGARALRQPGSTLKPFLYALALEKLGFTAATALPDLERHFATDGGDFVPHDYDGLLRGPVRLREALGNSLNIPAVWTLEQVGVEPFYTRLRALGFESLSEAPEYYGLALALGDGEVTLLELANAYAALARGGVLRPLRMVRRIEHEGGRVEELFPAEGRRVMPAVVAQQIGDILRDPNARTAAFGDRTVLDFPFAVAAKTGTSKGYRDNWVAGYTDKVTVAVWVGNFDGAPMGRVSGITGAGPIFHAVMDAAMARHGGAQSGGGRGTGEDGRGAHDGLRRVEVCALSGGLATADCPHRVDEWVAADAELATCAMHERVRVERHDGLRAGAECLSGNVIERVYEHFPPEYLAWAESAARPVAPRTFSPHCPEGPVDPRAARPTADASVRILYPSPDARFVLDPERALALQVLDVHIAVPEGAREAALLVDGQVVDRVRAPFVARWPLAAGAHTLSAETGSALPSDPVRVEVRGL